MDSYLSVSKYKTLKNRMKERVLKAYFRKSINQNINLDENSLHEDALPEEESEEYDEIQEIEDKLNNRKKQNDNNGGLMRLVLGDHFLTFQYDRDLYTLLYTSIIFKWFASERVRYIILILDNHYY